MSQSNETPKRSAFAIFRKRNFSLLWSGQLVSEFGNGITSIFLSKMTERMVRMNMLDIPRATGRDQQLLRDLRTPDPQPAT